MEEFAYINSIRCVKETIYDVKKGGLFGLSEKKEKCLIETYRFRSGRLVEKEIEYMNPTWTKRRHTTYQYINNEKIVEERDYDSSNCIISTTNMTVDMEYDLVKKYKSVTYYSSGNKNLYDPDYKWSHKILLEGESFICRDKDGAETHYFYGNNKKRTKKISYDANGNISEEVYYNINGKVINEVQYDEDGSVKHSEKSYYNEDGLNVRTIVNGLEETCVYDGYGNMIRRTWYPGMQPFEKNYRPNQLVVSEFEYK